MRAVINHVPVWKALLLVGFAVLAPFVSLENALSHWTWIAFGSLAAIIAVLEIIQYRQQSMTPEQRVKQYLLDFEGWQEREGIQHYTADPRYTLRVNDTDESLDFRQEWTRGEIGRHNEHGNSAYYIGVFFGATLLRNIHIVLFDGGKKLAVAPAWEPIGNGRIYYYVADSIEYAYHQFLAHQRGVDDARGLRALDETGEFDIPVFANADDLHRFLSLCGSEDVGSTSDEQEQNRLFLKNLETYQHFRKGWAV